MFWLRTFLKTFDIFLQPQKKILQKSIDFHFDAFPVCNLLVLIIWGTFADAPADFLFTGAAGRHDCSACGSYLADISLQIFNGSLLSSAC